MNKKFLFHDDDDDNDDDEDNDDDDDDDDDDNMPIQAPPILPFCLPPRFRLCSLIPQLTLWEWARITLNYFQIALHRGPPHLGYHKRHEGLSVKTPHLAAHPSLQQEEEMVVTFLFGPNIAFYLRRLTPGNDFFQLRGVGVRHHSKALSVHLWLQVEHLAEGSSTDDDFRVQVARFQLHQFGEIGGRTDQNATHAHNLKG